jgi:hypothetical protein
MAILRQLRQWSAGIVNFIILIMLKKVVGLEYQMVFSAYLRYANSMLADFTRWFYGAGT